MVVLWKNLKNGFSKRQFGLAGTQIVDAILQLETMMQVTAFAQPAGGAAFMMDYKNAFPSLRRAYLKRVLRRLKVPKSIIKCICNLMANCKHYVFPHIHSDFIIFVLDGLKQGCPLAALLFSLCILPFINALEKVTSPAPSLTS